MPYAVNCVRRGGIFCHDAEDRGCEGRAASWPAKRARNRAGRQEASSAARERLMGTDVNIWKRHADIWINLQEVIVNAKASSAEGVSSWVCCLAKGIPVGTGLR